jgi:hypothetical protein
MKNQQTYAVVDTITGELIGTELTHEEKEQCLFLNKIGCNPDRLAVYKEAPGLVASIYDKAADVYSDGAEAYHDGDKEHANTCRDESEKLLNIAAQLEESYGEEA